MLVYARNKVGKTKLCASAGQLGKTLIIDCEKGSKSARKSRNVDVYRLENFSEIDEIYWYLANEDHGYEYVAIDPITKLGNHCIRFILEDDAERDLTADPGVPDQRTWGKAAELMRNVILRYTELPGIFLIITAYERRRDSDDEDSDYDYVIGPDAQPAVKGFLMGQMDIIGRLYIKALDSDDDEDSGVKVERRLLFGNHEVYESGDRSDNLPRVMRRPTMKKIMDAISQEVA